jgi:hypothetical protein
MRPSYAALVALIFAHANIANAKPKTRPDPKDHVATARWMAHTFTWGYLSTISTRSQGTATGIAFGNPYSFADVEGVPYFFASDLDASMIDLFASADAKPRASFTLTEAQLTGTSTSVPGCVIGDAFNDPENPPCGRFVLTGKTVKLAANTTEEKAALKALVVRHPSFSQYAGLGFYVVKMEVDSLWFIDGYGGADYMKPSDYFGANLLLPPSHIPEVTRPGPPKPSDKVGTARWMAHTFTYGSLATTLTRSRGSTVGDAFGNPYSFADIGGVPYFFASDLDASMIDLFTASDANTSASFALSEAQLKGDREIAACKIGAGFNDPENPPCGRVVFSGQMQKLKANTKEEKDALAALTSRHPSFSQYAGLGFYVVKMMVSGIFFLDGYGGADYMRLSDYFSYNATSTSVSLMV